MGRQLDVRGVAESMFAGAKELLQKHGDLSPRGFVLEATGELEVVDLYGPNETERRERVREFRQKARRAITVASFTICHTTYQVFEPFRPEEAVEMPSGWVVDRQPHGCIEMRIEARGQEGNSVIVPYRRHPNGVVDFGEQWEGPEDFEGLPPPSCEAEEGLKN